MIAPDTLLQNRYLVKRQIGQGGMGAVYVATDQRFGSTVALKETFFDEVSMRKAFEREARLLNHLRHPALPRVSDHFTEDEGQFLVMEYIGGEDLAEKLKERGGAFPSSEVLNWADQLLDALDYLHTQEPPVIHRDIKPQNLKLTPRNHIVLLDFGLAKGTPAMHVSKVTATGSVFGYSRHYAPLEQIQGAGTDPRSDLYSLGATLYHLITGVVPPDALTRATNILNGQPDPLLLASEVHPQVTPAIATVISNAMAHNAGERPQSASAMREALREAARQGHSISRETTPLQPSSTDVYEQETQLIYGAVSPATATGDDANKTGPIVGAAATAVNSNTDPVIAGSPATRADAGQSVITKIAERPSTPASWPRKRVIGIAASAVVVLVLAAVVYTLTRNPALTTTSNDNVQPTPIAAESPAPENQNGPGSGDPVIIIKKEFPEPTPNQESPAKSARSKSPANPEPEEENVEPDQGNPPIPPNATPRNPGVPQTTPLRDPRAVDRSVQDALRDAEERRRAADESRRQALEERRRAMQRERIIEMQRRRRRLP